MKRRCGVDRIPQRPEVNAPILKGGDRLEQVPQGPAKAVEPDDDERVAGGQAVKKVVPDGTGRRRRRFPRQRSRSQRLEVARLRFHCLFARGDAGVSMQGACPGHKATPVMVEGRSAKLGCMGGCPLRLGKCHPSRARDSGHSRQTWPLASIRTDVATNPVIG